MVSIGSLADPPALEVWSEGVWLEGAWSVVIWWWSGGGGVESGSLVVQSLLENPVSEVPEIDVRRCLSQVSVGSSGVSPVSVGSSGALPVSTGSPNVLLESVG